MTQQMFVGYLACAKHHSLDCNEIQPVHPKGDESWVFTGRTDAKADLFGRHLPGTSPN